MFDKETIVNIVQETWHSKSDPVIPFTPGQTFVVNSFYKHVAHNNNTYVGKTASIAEPRSHVYF